MASRNRSCVVSLQSFILFIIMILAFISIRYIVPVRVPGPMTHPIKYKMITGTFALILDIVSDVNEFHRRFPMFFI
jgi:hypothetical protein